MNKAFINRICGKLGFEVNGTSYMQSLRKSALNIDAYEKQHELLGGKANVIFDLGANNGNITRKYKELFPKAAVHSFEPFPEMFTVLSKATANLNDVHISDKAISDKSETRTFYVNAGADTNSLLESQATGLNSDEQVKNKTRIDVKTISLAQYCADHNIDQIDILKMDIQGGELDALRGAENLLAGRKIRLIYTETNFIPQYVGQPLFQDLMVYLYKFGYRLQDIYNPIYGKGSIAWCDAIYLPEK